MPVCAIIFLGFRVWLLDLTKVLESLEEEWYEALDPRTSKPTKGGFIRDPIHGHIGLDPIDFFVIDLPPLQRLRGILQLSFVDRIYPGANHTRFEHAIGVATLASRILQSIKARADKGLMDYPIKVTESDLLAVRLAGYFHDIGHLPFSHLLEPLFHDTLKNDYLTQGMKEGDNKPHELLGYLILKSQYFKDAFHQISQSVGFTVDEDLVADLAMGTKAVPNEKTYLREIIHGDFDCDRMDYILRDSYYCGVPHGSVDPERLIETFTLASRNGSGIHLGIEEQGLPSIEAMYFSRSTMYITVYHHHVSRITEGMILRAGHDMIKEGKIDLPTFLEHSDASLLQVMRTAGTALSRAIVDRLMNRRLFKRLFVRRLADFKVLRDLMIPGAILPKSIGKNTRSNLRDASDYFAKIDNNLKFESECAESIYPSSERFCSLLFDCPKLELPRTEPNMEEYFTVRLRDKSWRPILELSPIIRTTEIEREAFVKNIILAGNEPERYSQKASEYVIERFNTDFSLG
jgi:HD superfamily phosphohydrolase